MGREEIWYINIYQVIHSHSKPSVRDENDRRASRLELNLYKFFFIELRSDWFFFWT